MPNDSARILTAAKLQAREDLSRVPAVETRNRLESLRPSLSPVSHTAIRGISLWVVKLRAVLPWNSESGIPSRSVLGLFRRACSCAPPSLPPASCVRLLSGFPWRSLFVALALWLPARSRSLLVLLSCVPSPASLPLFLVVWACAGSPRSAVLAPLLRAFSCLSARSRCPVLPRSLDSGFTMLRSHSLAQRQAWNESVPHGPPDMPHS